MSYRVGVDVDGTFTDLVAFQNRSGAFRIAKVPPFPVIPPVPSHTPFSSASPTLSRVIHNSTVATNAVIERKGTRCGLITNLGFRDVIEMGRRDRPSAYGFASAFVPLVLRRDRYEVGGRVSAHLSSADTRVSSAAAL